MKHIYLIQGEKNLNLSKYENGSRVFIQAVWGEEPNEGVLDARKITATEGRNLLLQHALDNYEFDYATFQDGDVIFVKGSYDEYEATLEKYNLPLYHSLDLSASNDSLRYEINYGLDREKDGDDIYFIDWIDTCFCSFRKDVIDTYLPWLTKFDHQNWWYPIVYLNILTRLKGHHWAITLNVHTDNMAHTDYTKTPGDIHPIMSRDVLKYVITNHLDELENMTLTGDFPWPIVKRPMKEYLKELEDGTARELYANSNNGITRFW